MLKELSKETSFDAQEKEINPEVTQIIRRVNVSPGTGEIV